MDTPWSKFYDSKYISLDSHEQSVYDLFCSTIEEYENDVALSYGSFNITYKELKEEVDDLAFNFIQRGFGAGSVVSIISPMSPVVMMAFLALNKIGAIFSIVNYLSPDSLINQILKDAKSDGLIIFSRRSYRLRDLIENTRVDKVFIWSDKDFLNLSDRAKQIYYKLKKGETETPPAFEGAINGVDITSWNDFSSKNGIADNIYSATVTSDNSALYLHQSSLLDSAGIEVFTNKAIISACNSVKSGYKLAKFRTSNGVLCNINYDYSATFIFAHVSMLCAGIRLILNPLVSIREFADSVLDLKPSIIIGYPTSFTTLVEQLSKSSRKYKQLDFIKLIIAAGTSFVTTKRKFCEDFFRQRGSRAKISVCYGLAESLLTASFVPRGYDRNNSIGVPLPGVLMKIIEVSTQRELPAGEKGEICICSDGIINEVLENNVMTSKILRKHRDGRLWIHTGDVGHMDEEGFFYFDYVEKRCAKINGISISLKHIEDVIKTVYGVFDVCVVDYCNEEGDTKLVALVVPIESFLTDNDRLEALMHSMEIECEMMLTPISRPSEYEYKAYLPRIGSSVDYKSLTKEVIEKRFSNME